MAQRRRKGIRSSRKADYVNPELQEVFLQSMDNSDPFAKTVLLLTDDEKAASTTEGLLKKEGFRVLLETCPQTVRGPISDFLPDLIIFEIVHKATDELAICKKIRSRYDGPFLVLSVWDDSIHQILMLDLGADDYVVKPVDPSLLLARTRALLRRAEPMKRRRVFVFGELNINTARREVTRKGKNIRLTSIEFDLLQHLIQNAGNVVSRDEIHRALYSLAYNGLDRSIDIYISRIRRKLGDDAFEQKYLKTIRGVGYLFCEDSAD